MQKEITELKGTIAGMQQTISDIIGSVKTIDYVNDIKQSNVFKEYVSFNNQIAKICTFSNGVKICSLNLSIKVKKANNFNNFEILYLPNAILTSKNIVLTACVNREYAFAYIRRSSSAVVISYNKQVNEDAEVDIIGSYIL